MNLCSGLCSGAGQRSGRVGRPLKCTLPRPAGHSNALGLPLPWCRLTALLWLPARRGILRPHAHSSADLDALDAPSLRAGAGGEGGAAGGRVSRGGCISRGRALCVGSVQACRLQRNCQQVGGG